MNWLSTTIGDVCLPTVQADPSRSGATNFRYIDIAGIDRDSKSISRAEEVRCDEAPSRARKIIQASDVLVSTVRPNLNAVAIVPDDLDGEIASTGFAVLRANPRYLNPKYLYYWVQHREFVDYLISNVTGASYPAVTDNLFRRCRMPLATPTEQFRIVELLDEADRLRRLRRDADAKAARILPALFLEMFGDPATNPKAWPVVTVGSAIQDADYGTSTKASDNGSGLPLIRMGNVSYDGNLFLDDLKYVELQDQEIPKFRLENGDLLFNRTNSKELVGKTGIWDVDMEAVLASYFIRVRVDRTQIEPNFLWAFMNSSYMKRELRATARGAIGQSNINTTELRAFPMYKPPLAVQVSFSKRVSAIKSAIPSTKRSNDLESLFTVMLQRAFSGQLTAKWHKVRNNELLAELEQQARLLNLSMPKELEASS